MAGDKMGARAYDPVAFGMRGLHEIANSLYPESNIPLRDHSGLYGSKEDHDREPHPNREVEHAEPEREYDEPELDR
jgi:hypothetical protein